MKITDLKPEIVWKYAALREKGICCAKTQHRRDSLRKNLYDKIKEIEE